MQKENNTSSLVMLVLVFVALVGTAMYFVGRSNTKSQPTKSIDAHSQTTTIPSIMELSASQYKDAVKYPDSGYTLRTITIESFIQDEDGNKFIKEENGPHFSLDNDTNLDESSVSSTFDCLLQRDDTGFTSGITVGKCVQR
ncbi:MAG: hypothetical protein WA087_00655 [Candidatus Saccharimonadales bacterium]